MFCEKHECKLSERACMLRQGLARRKAGVGFAPSQYAYCLECEQGKAVAQKTEAEGRMPKIYTAKEKDFLAGNIDKMSNRQLAEKLGRSEGAIAAALSNLGLKRSNPRKAGVDEKTHLAKPDDTGTKTLLLDFSQYPEVLAAVYDAAHKEIRTPEAQVLFWLKQRAAEYSDE